MKFAKIILILGGIISLAGCNNKKRGTGNPTENIIDNTVYPSYIVAEGPLDNKMFVGTNFQISYKVYPEDAANKSVAFSTSNSQVATVSSAGKVEALSPGSVEITITSVAKESVTKKLYISVKKIVDDF